MMNRILKWVVIWLTVVGGAHTLWAQDETASVRPRFMFRFVEGDDMFYVPYSGNGSRLDSLCLRLVPMEIAEGAIRVDGYSSSRSLSMIRCNRVKSELIVRCGVQEKHFTTSNNTGTFNGMRNVVVVTIPAARQAKEDIEERLRSDAAEFPESSDADEMTLPVVGNEPLPEFPFIAEEPLSELPCEPVFPCGDLPRMDVQPIPVRWSVGVNVGVPFLWGDMVTAAYDKTYVGIAAGVQGSYRFSHLLGVTLAVDYVHGKTGARSYSKNYMLSPDGMTSYGSQPDAVPYGDLYSRISGGSVGLSLDVNINRIFSRDAFRHRFTVWISPTLYGQFFGSHQFLKADNLQFSDGSLHPASVSLGLGGSLTLRCRLSGCVELQLKNSLVWITDNNFDGITTPYGQSRQNAMWTPQLGIVWNIK